MTVFAVVKLFSLAECCLLPEPGFVLIFVLILFPDFLYLVKPVSCSPEVPISLMQGILVMQL